MSVIVCVSAGIMLIMNVIRHSTLMTITSAILVCGFALTGVLAGVFKKIKASTAIMAVLLTGVFTVFPISGGDEFAVIDYGRLEEIAEKVGMMKKYAVEHKGRFVEQVHLSADIASQSEYSELTPEGLFRKADKFMYEDKSAFYRQKGHDRRSR